jgi:hypothetical protein
VSISVVEHPALCRSAWPLCARDRLSRVRGTRRRC